MGQPRCSGGDRLEIVSHPNTFLPTSTNRRQLHRLHRGHRYVSRPYPVLLP